MPDLTAPDVIEKAMAGSTDAFRTIVEDHQSFAYAVAFRFVGNEDDAEDLVQEMFIKLWKNLKSYRHEIKLSTWLYRILVNLCLDFLKSGATKRKRSNVNIDSVHFVADNSNPENEFQQRELMQAIQNAAEELTPKQRAVFILRDLENLSVLEVMEILSMPAGNVKSNLFCARKKMGEKLKSFYQTSDKQFTP
jgi:RNA polymerase sigma-70 factor, ECF subfamily